jgi:ATP-dependent DNA ligase
MAMQVPPKPMLTAVKNTTVVPAGVVVEPKWDGFRGIVARWSDGRVQIRSRHGTDMTAGFPEIARAAAALPARIGDILLDGELVIREGEKLAFEHLQSRIGATAATARRLAAAHPAHMVVFDLLHLGDLSIIDQPYRDRRALLERTFDVLKLGEPWELCPASTDRATIARWLTEWPARYGTEGIVMKRPAQAYRPGARAWLRYRVHESTEGIIGAVTGTPSRPTSLLLGRLDDHGRLQYVARTTPLDRRIVPELAAVLTPAHETHPWHRRKPSPRWNPPNPEEITLVAPEVVAEFTGDLAQDPRGAYRHLVHFDRIRPDLAPTDTPRASAGRDRATS